MEIKFYNSITRKVEVFKPIKENEISIYVCGPTVYNDPHIGNMRPVVFFDTVRKFFEKVGYKVNYVSNFTDVDDKIINKALDEGVEEKVISERYIDAYLKCIYALNVKKATKNPRVTEYMPDIINYIQHLIDTDYAYQVGGEVFFSIDKIKDYGILSNTNTDELKSGARIQTNDKKLNPYDFVLWKETEKGIKWETQFCTGRPGWHTECCVMIDSIFKGMIDIHGGGSDLKFPHHENEIAQAEATHGNHLANYWIHTAMMNISGEKMSKSLGNVILTKDAIKLYGGDLVRLILLNAQYRSIINFTPEIVEDNRAILTKVKNAYRQLNLKIQLNNGLLEGNSSKTEDFLKILADDFNIPNAITYMLDMVKQANQVLRNRQAALKDIEDVYYALNDIIYILGLGIENKALDPEDLALYKEYEQLKSEKKFEESDKLRQVLIDKKIL